MKVEVYSGVAIDCSVHKRNLRDATADEDCEYDYAYCLGLRFQKEHGVHINHMDRRSNTGGNTIGFCRLASMPGQAMLALVREIG